MSTQSHKRCTARSNKNIRNSRKTRKNRSSKPGKVLTVLFFVLVVPVILGLIALFKSVAAEAPEKTTADFMNKRADQYLHVVTEKYQMNMELESYSAEMTETTPTGSLSDDQIFNILGLDAENSEIKDGKLYSTLSSGQELSISDKSVMVDHHYFKVYDDGHIYKVFDGYNSQHGTEISLANKKRTLEELASIAMIADSVEEIGDDYSYANVSGSTSGPWWFIFAVYLIGVLVVFVCIKLWKAIKD